MALSPCVPSRAKSGTTGTMRMSDHSWTWNSSCTIPSDTGAGRQLVDELLAQLNQAAWDEQDVFGIHLAFEEALVNAIKHGNQHDSAKSVHVVCKLSADIVRLEIRDEGGGFDPEAVPDPTEEENLEVPSGRGLMLMRSFMSMVEYNDVGNHVIMEKRRAEQTA